MKKEITTFVVKHYGRTGLLIRKHSPELLIGTGVVALVGSTVLACKATLKAQEVIDEHHRNLEKIEAAKALGVSEEEYSNAEKGRDLLVTYARTGVGFAKLYGPSVSLGILGIGCILGAHHIMKQRNLAAIAAYKLVEEGFAQYRKRVVEELGETKDRQFKTGVREVEVVEPAYVDENGVKHKAEKKTIEVIDPDHKSVYARYYDENCKEWTNRSDYNLMRIKAQEDYFNNMLKIRGHVFLNEIYDQLGMERTKAGQIVGWVFGAGGDNIIDFGIYAECNKDFVNMKTPNVLLDFNVDGVVYDLI
ncbi:MAG: DUF6353 family protein [Oscillospiraceae bacterium]|nr:DUF6353 family protein [Oscillospiraceae bacterium]